MKRFHAILALSCLVAGGTAHAESMNYADVQATGAKPLTAAEVRGTVAGAKAEFTQNNGTVRRWTHEADGTFVASRDRGDLSRRTARGKWEVKDDGLYCLSFDWGSMDVESWCRRLYKMSAGYYAFSPEAGPETRSGQYRFTR